MARIIKLERSVIPACDVADLEAFRNLIRQTHDVEGIGGYKIDSALALKYSLPEVVRIVREFTEKPIIYDHQKWGTDIPDSGLEVLHVVKEAGVDAIIIFPQSGPQTQEAYIKAANDFGLGVISGGEMTHKGYKRSEGGYIADEALAEMYLLSANLGVTNFVVPGNRVERIEYYMSVLKPKVKGQISLWAPGFVAQGGKISDAAKVAGESFHAIVGRGIYAAADMHAAALELTSQLRGD
ncbi:MAG: orotidine 5'-phosphate decarboxylase [Candidatus Micrarchaeota archaeon]|nr:orotidine 5'-phosphate decarboxylase [Candidatus Micrarchaeota archaeon]